MNSLHQRIQYNTYEKRFKICEGIREEEFVKFYNKHYSNFSFFEEKNFISFCGGKAFIPKKGNHKYCQDCRPVYNHLKKKIEYKTIHEK